MPEWHFEVRQVTLPRLSEKGALSLLSSLIETSSVAGGGGV